MKGRKAEPLVFNKIYELYSQFGCMPAALHPESAFTIFNLRELGLPSGFQSPVYRANFFLFVFVKNARGYCSTDYRMFETQPGSVYFNNPGHIKQFSVDFVDELYLIALHESFLKENVHVNIFDEFSFLLSEIVPPQVLPPEQFGKFEELYLQIEAAYRSDSPYRWKLIGHLFAAILFKIKEYFWKDYDPIADGDRASQIVKSFKQMIEQHYRDLCNGLLDRPHRLQEYADMLSLHPNYLNTVIKTKTGRSVGNWIVEKTITEAKSLLRNSDMPVKEISCRLGFLEIQHFSNYFKKYTQYSPVVYRKGVGIS